ncbi:unnamed protein product [Mycena citricolor]|uniref:Glucose-methanol-choline oxidoreductase N-terminal domain-containing protein n=1 Tax=Mycena citricolor TaxID=2018698 RepID=A0AAD2HCB8_9AGAR|nr:unnamed protein product [Mycena citricolor]
MLGIIASLLLLFLVTDRSQASIHSGPSAINDLKHSPDFIIVGGGTAGSVVANRLSENPNVTVLVLEAGISNAGILNIEVPFYCVQASPQTSVDWNFTTVPQPALNNRSVAYPRGFVLGGSSSTNYMFYTRGTRDDYDRIANVTEDEGWSWDHLFPYMLKSERWTAPSDGHNTTGQFDPSVHGSSGINSVALSGFPSDIDSRVIAATKEVTGMPFNLDMNSGNPLGIGWKQDTAANGLRSSAATSYLAPNFINRPNLHVVLNTRVTRVLSHKDASSFTTVEYITAQGNRSTITAGKEVILSAGAVGTPHILLHSGIGDAHALSKLGIRPVHNLPSVGQNLTDHPALHTLWLVNSTNTYETLKRNATVAAAALAEWTQSKQGPLVTGPGSHIGWARVSGNDSTIFDNTADSSAGPTSPHFELIFAPGSLGPPHRLET